METDAAGRVSGLRATVALVIPGRNASRTLRQCLTAVALLREAGAVSQVVFVDDGSTDDSPEIARSLGAEVVRRSEPGGPGAARNTGWRSVKAELIWFIDADCVLDPAALDCLLPHFDDADVAGVGGSYTNAAPGSLLARLIHEEILDRHLRAGDVVDHLGAYNVLYRRSILEEFGGFDEYCVNGPGSPGAEDADLSYRIARAGWKLRLDRRSRVAHFHPTRLPSYLRTQRNHGYWRVNLHIKHRRQGAGDSYSGWADHLQPVVAWAAIGSLLTLASSVLWPIAAGTFLGLLALQVPMTVRLVRRTRDPRYLLFAALGIVRAFARALGLAWGVSDAALTLLLRRSLPCSDADGRSRRLLGPARAMAARSHCPQPVATGSDQARVASVEGRS